MALLTNRAVDVVEVVNLAGTLLLGGNLVLPECADQVAAGALIPIDASLAGVHACGADLADGS